MFHCDSGECIFSFHLCSGKAECSDSSDETQESCNPESRQCENDPSLMRCHDGLQCYHPNEACDGVNQCDDQTDELSCHVSNLFNGQMFEIS